MISHIEVIVIIVIIAIFLYMIYNLIAVVDIVKFFTGRGQGMPRIFTQDPWIDEIISGKKTVEARVGTVDQYEKMVGKKVKIVGSGKKVIAKVTAIRHYKDLDSFLQKEGWKAVAPQTKSEKAAKEAYLEITSKNGAKIYDDVLVRDKGGIVALEFEIEK
jgi:ASC-1-like (ASCH) protein